MSELEPTNLDPSDMNTQFQQLGVRLQGLFVDLSKVADNLGNRDMANQLLNQRDRIQDVLDENDK